MNLFDQAIQRIDEYNSQDPNIEIFKEKEYPKELLYAQRMTAKLKDFEPKASEELKIAAHAQHICRWKIPREEYPMTRVGYLKLREDLKKMHARLTSEILDDVGYNEQFIKRVSFLITKKLIKKDKESQAIEDVICLVFLEYYFDDFASKHPDDKIIDILQKTWAKMSDEGRQAALQLPLSQKSKELVSKALA